MNALDREKLAAILESFGDSIASFDALRPDSYEHALACQSLERLEHFYSQIMQPGLTQEQARQNCPPWPKGKYAGQLPSTKIISDVSERIRTNAALRQVRPIGQFLKELRKEIKATPLGENQAILDAFCGAIGQQMMKDVRDGKPIGDSLKLMERLQQQRVIEQNQERLEQNDRKLAQNDRRIKVLEENQASAKAKLESAVTSLKSKGGLTPETLSQIEEAAKLL